MIEEHHAGFLQAPWRSMTLHGLARGAALLRPGAILIADAADKQALCGRPSRQLTAADLDVEAALLGQKLGALGLRPGETILVALPNIVEAASALLAIVAAGAIPATLPVFEPAERWIEAAKLAGATGILTIERFAGLPLAEIARTVAANVETIRFVAAFGERAPGGVAALDSWKTVEFIKPPPTSIAPADAPALITFDTVGGQLRAFERTHEHLVADAATLAAQAHVAAGSALLVTLPPVTAAGVVAGIVLPLLAGARADLDALFDDCAFGTRLGRGKGLTIVLPAVAEEAFNSHCIARQVKSETLVFVHRPTPDAGLRALPPVSAAHRRVDSIWLGEACGWLMRRDRPFNPAAGMGFAKDLFVGDIPPLSLQPGEAGLVASGVMVARNLAGGDQAVVTGFSSGLLEEITRRPLTRTRPASAA